MTFFESQKYNNLIIIKVIILWKVKYLFCIISSYGYGN
jgi:hypothetical protein